MLQFLCPHCSSAIRAGPQQAGQLVRCPSCTKVLQAPVAPTIAPLIKPGPPPLPRRRPVPNLLLPLALTCGVSGLPVAVVLASGKAGVVVLTAGLALAILGFAVSLARRGAELALAITAVAVCVSGLYVASAWPVPKPAVERAVARTKLPRLPDSPDGSRPTPERAADTAISPKSPRAEANETVVRQKEPPRVDFKKDREEPRRVEANGDAPKRPPPPPAAADRPPAASDAKPPAPPAAAAEAKRPVPPVPAEPKASVPAEPKGPAPPAPSASKRPSPPAAEESPAALSLLHINDHRRAAGQRPVTLDEKLSRACQAHADYLARNRDDPITRAGGPHIEDPRLPGYTREGEEAGHMGVINMVATNQGPDRFDPSKGFAVDSLMSTFFHRIPLIHPNLRRVGFAFAHRAEGGLHHWVTVIDIRDSRRFDGKRGWIVVYPGNAQKDVPTTFHNVEHPNPTPEEGANKNLGYCVTATFAANFRVMRAEATLTGPDGVALPAWVSTPAQPVQGNPNLQMNTVCLIAKAPLLPGTTYTATVTARVNGTDWRRSWTFTTSAD